MTPFRIAVINIMKRKKGERKMYWICAWFEWAAIGWADQPNRDVAAQMLSQMPAIVQYTSKLEVVR